MNSSKEIETGHLLESLVQGAALELYLTPKPGLVDLSDCGSHPDLSLTTMENSIHSIADYLLELQRSLASGERFEHQIAIARRAERNMNRLLGTNTHKGYLFLSGIMLIANWRSRFRDESSLRSTIAALARYFFSSKEVENTNGHQARQRFRAGGIIREACAGYPSLFNAALPAFRRIIALTGCFRTASFAMLARLMQTVEDTTTLHRSGDFGLSRIRRDGGILEALIEEGGDYLSWLRELNRLYTLKRITMGGVADMLALAYGYLIHRGEIILRDKDTCAASSAACCFDELSILIRRRPACAIWFGQPFAAGLQYEVPPAVCRREALEEMLLSVCSPAW